MNIHKMTLYLIVLLGLLSLQYNGPPEDQKRNRTEMQEVDSSTGELSNQVFNNPLPTLNDEPAKANLSINVDWKEGEGEGEVNRRPPGPIPIDAIKSHYVQIRNVKDYKDLKLGNAKITDTQPNKLRGLTKKEIEDYDLSFGLSK